MTDRELLEMAAKAAGYYFCNESMGEAEFYCVPISEKELVTNWSPTASGRNRYEGTSLFKWNPLADDGDALRLAVQLANTYENFHSIIWNWTHREIRIFAGGCEGYGDSPYAATRRAIVCAAAEIGKRMK